MSRPGLKQVTQAREMIDDIARDSCGNKLFTVLRVIRVEAAQQATLLLHSTTRYALLLSSPMARDSNHDLTRPPSDRNRTKSNSLNPTCLFPDHSVST